MKRRMGRPGRAERDLLRRGARALEYHDIPWGWAYAFANADASIFEGEAEPAWGEDAARRWEAEMAARGYAFAGTAHDGANDLGEFAGVHGRTVRGCFTSQAVLDSDAIAGVWSVSGCDAGPTEHVLRREVDAVVRLPANFEPRLLDPHADVDEPRTDGVLPVDTAVGRGERGPERVNDGSADQSEIDQMWTEAACDAAALRLAQAGWTVETPLAATTRQGWYGALWGETMLFVLTRDMLAEDRIADLTYQTPAPYRLPRSAGTPLGRED